MLVRSLPAFNQMPHRSLISNGMLTMSKHLRSCICAFIAVVLLSISTTPAALTQRDVSREPARQSRAWVRDGVIYEIFTRNFSPQGNFNGVTAQLDRLKERSEERRVGKECRCGGELEQRKKNG